MSDIAEELAVRTSPAYLKARGKEIAVSKASQKRMELKDNVREHPNLWRAIGGMAGVGVASLLLSRFQHRDARRIDAGWRRDPTYGTRGRDLGYGMYAGAENRGREESGSAAVAWAKGAAHDLKEQGSHIKERGSEVAHKLKDRGSEVAHKLKDRGSAAAHPFQDRDSSGEDGSAGLKERGAELKDRGLSMLHEREAQLKEQGGRLRQRVEDDPIPIVLGALALGAVAAFLLPVSRKEQELTEPISGRMRERMDAFKGEASSRIGQVREQAEESLSSFREQATETLKGHEGDHSEYGRPNGHDTSQQH